jgi:thiamine-monophosphate kinase
VKGEAHGLATPLAGGAEFDLIRTLVERWGTRARDIGDDAAVLRVPRGDALVASVDATVEGRHFRDGWLTPREIGYRAVTAALSDLAAMAARPLGILLALGIPEAWSARVEEIGDGVGDAVSAAGTVILGGNIVATGELSLTTTVLGSAYAPLRRGGARPGDHIYVTGRLGGPAAAIASWTRGALPEALARERFAHPVARLAEARWLADRGVTAMIDISDGFAHDLEQLASATGSGADVELSDLPLLPPLTDAVAAAASGEEFELLVTSSELLDASEFERRFSLPLTRVGRITSARGTVVYTVHGERVAKPAGYDHLSR